MTDRIPEAELDEAEAALTFKWPQFFDWFWCNRYIKALIAAYAETDTKAERIAELEAEQDEEHEHNERLEKKLRDWGAGCSCGYDNEGDVCAMHHPRIQKAEAERDKVVDVLWKYARHSPLCGQGPNPRVPCTCGWEQASVMPLLGVDREALDD